MREITKGLSGDSETDIAYLKEQMKAYKDHEMGKEIIRACARLMYDLMPDDKKKDLEKVISNNASGTEATLEEVRFNIYKKDFNKALQIIEALVTKIEALNAFEDDKVSEYHDFEEWFEEVLYQYRSKTEKDMRHAQIPYREMYLLYGVLLVELKRIPEAQEALKKGLRWNPVCFHMMSEYIESYKMSGDLEKEAFKIAFRPTDLAQCYRNLGYYFVEKKLWPEAIACNLLSLEYDKEAKAAQSELYYINNATDGKIPEPSIDQTREYSKKYGFPFGPDRDILGLSYAYGKHFLEEKEPNAARYFLSITYGLTGDPEIKEIIEKLSQEE